MEIEFQNIDPSEFKGILIDLDDTLYRYDPCHEIGLEAAYTLEIWPDSREDFARLYRESRNRVTDRLHGQGACRSRLFAFQSMCEAVGLVEPFVAAMRLDRAYWTNFIAAMEPDRGALAFLHRCRDLGKPVCVVSDMTAHIQIEKLVRLGVQSLISHLVTSEEIGAEKPDPRMFRAGLAKIGVEAGHALMIGDDFRKDIWGSTQLGLTAHLIKLKA